MNKYNLPDIKLSEDLSEDLENIESVIDDLNSRRDNPEEKDEFLIATG